MQRDFELLGVARVAELARRNPEKVYEKLCRITGQPQDICCLDVFRAAVAQARIRVSGGTMQMVVLESQTKGSRWRPLKACAYNSGLSAVEFAG